MNLLTFSHCIDVRWRRHGWVSAHDEHRALCLQEGLDVEAMREAATVLVGRHDFSAFRGSRCTAGSPTLTLDGLDVIVEQQDTLDGLRDGRGAQSISVRVRAQSFLRKQVRYLVAVLVEAGSGRLKSPAEDVRGILSSGNTDWGKPVAPHGLYLARVDYPKEAYTNEQ
jgi:tRNA pseudouridine38-40 synthase